eukprot:Skav229285  [mRNA]  locus=scaffold952:412056:413933:+ [translate_table: standard]
MCRLQQIHCELITVQSSLIDNSGVEVSDQGFDWYCLQILDVNFFVSFLFHGAREHAFENWRPRCKNH